MSTAVVPEERCELCGESDVRKLHASLDIGRCGSCGLVSVLGKPSAGELASLYSSTRGYLDYVAAKREVALDKRYAETLEQLTSLLVGRRGRQLLFDVGAGSGAFLQRASEHGFDVGGNEISGPAIQLCYERHGIRLSDRVIEEHASGNRFDAMTMWCVLAHVPEPRESLAAPFRLLNPRGVLFFQTPRWCARDTAGLCLCRLSGGALSQITHRRIGPAHMRLYSQRNLTRLVTSIGFDVLRLRPKSVYSMRTSAYLTSLKVPSGVHRSLGRGIDQLIDRDASPRNVLDVNLRKP